LGIMHINEDVYMEQIVHRIKEFCEGCKHGVCMAHKRPEWFDWY
jgi:hypothetical protein